MGVDMTVQVEQRQGEYWARSILQVEFTDMHRDYRLFALLAGVRAESTSPAPLVEPRGLPPDTTPLTKAALRKAKRAGEGVLTPTWFLLSELLAHFASIEEAQGEFAEALVGLKALGPPEQTRLILWFDQL